MTQPKSRSAYRIVADMVNSAFRKVLLIIFLLVVAAASIAGLITFVAVRALS